MAQEDKAASPPNDDGNVGGGTPSPPPSPRTPVSVRDRLTKGTRILGGVALVALAAWAIGTVLVVGLPTAMIPNPVFGRDVPTTWWAWPVLVATAVLGGLLGATYVRAGDEKVPSSGLVGGLLAYLAVGCPVCNKVALLALGYAGALQWFAPVQPVLGVIGLVLLVWALDRRLRGEIACALPVQRSRPGEPVGA